MTFKEDVTNNIVTIGKLYFLASDGMFDKRVSRRSSDTSRF